MGGSLRLRAAWPSCAAGGYVHALRDYYEELWKGLPKDLAMPDLELRRSFLLKSMRPSDRALDVGSGAGDFTAVLATAGARVTGVDVAQAAIDRAAARHPELDFQLVPIDGPLPFEDNQFDLVWASE